MDIDLITQSEAVAEHIVVKQMEYETDNESVLKGTFDDYAREWWNDYKQIRESHKKRVVPIFVETDERDLRVYRPATSLLTVLRPSRYIESPFHAFRFVSLIPLERSEALGGKRIERWSSFHSFLARGCGDVEDHCTLLCSLLLGFGLEAYVAVGTAGGEPHVWVITRVPKVGSPLKTIDFWETMTGQRMELTDPRVNKFYKTITCVFGYNKFYANIQPSDKVSATKFDFENDSHWKAMDEEQLKKIAPLNFPVSFREPEGLKSLEETEAVLKEKISDYRMSSMLVSTYFDEGLSYILSPALVNYELERISGLTFGNEEFKAAIAQAVPDGHTFKAFPIQVQSTDPKQIFACIIQNKTGREVLDTKGDSIRFAIRTKLIAYPEHISATWTIIAVRYRSID